MDKTATDNVFIKEVVNGKMIVIERLKVRHILSVQKESIPEEFRFAYIAVQILTIDGQQITAEQILDFEDLEVFNFIAESIGAMGKTKLF